jgi:hypothetical protein
MRQYKLEKFAKRYYITPNDKLPYHLILAIFLYVAEMKKLHIFL